MPRRQRRHPSKQVRLRLDTTTETSSRTSTPRVDSTSPLSLASGTPVRAPSWAYYTRNSSLERKRRLFELACKYGRVKAEVVCASMPMVEDVSSTIWDS